MISRFQCKLNFLSGKNYKWSEKETETICSHFREFLAFDLENADDPSKCSLVCTLFFVASFERTSTFLQLSGKLRAEIDSGEILRVTVTEIIQFYSRNVTPETCSKT